MDSGRKERHPLGVPAALWRNRDANHSYLGTIGVTAGKKCVISPPRGRWETKKIVIMDTTPGNVDSVPAVSLQLNNLLQLGCFFQPPCGEPMLANAPERVLRNIFTHLGDTRTLTRCESVCKTWRNIIQRSKLALKKTKVERVTFQHVAEECKRGCAFERRAEKQDKEGKSKLRKNWRKNSEFVSIRWNCTGDAAYLHLFMQRVLSKIDPYGIGFIGCKLTKHILSLVPRLSSNMRQLRFTRCYLETDALAGLKFVNSLKEFAIDQCFGSNDSISSESLVPVISKNTLKTLELCGAGALNKVDDRVLEALTTMWKYSHFDCLKLANCPNVSTSAISKVIDHFMRQDGRKAVIFLNKTGFDTQKFLDQSTGFSLDASPMTSQRILLKSGETTVWVELV